MVGKKKFIAQDGTELKNWHYGSLLYNRFLQMADSKKKLHFRLSEFKMPRSRQQRPIENEDLILLARLGDRDNLTEARKQLEAMSLVKFGDGKVDYAVTILNTPAIRGKKHRISKATKDHGHVSALAPNFHLNDRTEELFSAILDGD
jgi:hypothetical protein